MHVYQRAVWLIGVLLLNACAAIPKTEFVDDIQFDHYKTFAWVPHDEHEVRDPILDSDITEERIKQAVTATLVERGYSTVKGSPDFFVTFHTATKQRLKSVGYGMGLGYSNYRQYWRHSIHYATPAVESYEEGLIIIDIVDASDDRLVWRGWKVARLTQKNYSPEQIALDVEFILSAFPPS